MSWIKGRGTIFFGPLSSSTDASKLAFMDWTDDGIVLSAKKHGETSAIVTLLTPGHGRHLGLVRGGGKRAGGLLQPGNLLKARWQARLSEHLGTFRCELTEAFAAPVLRDRLKLAGLSAACAMAEGVLPERQPHRPVFEGLLALIRGLDDEDWPSAYVKWELGLLAEVGFGLDLSACAATGQNDQLAYVSTKTGRAVSLAAAKPYKKSLLTLPDFLLHPGAAGPPDDVIRGLKLTGYFLEKNIFQHAQKGLPAARNRLTDRLRAEPATQS